MSNAMHAIKKALTALIFDHPFYGQLAMSKLEIVEDTKSKFGGWTDGVQLSYSAKWIESVQDWETLTFVAHEVSHCSHGHSWRREGRDAKLYNIAADHVVNLELVDEGFKMWPWAYCDVRFKGMSTEEVYTILLREKQAKQASKPKPDPKAEPKKEKQGKPAKQEEQEEQEEPGDDEQDEEAAGDEGDEEEGDESDEQGDSKPPKGKGDSASQDEDEDAANSSPEASEEPEEDEDDGPRQPGEVRDVPIAQIDPDTLAAEWEVAIFQAATAAAAMGKLPAGIKQLVKEIRKPKLDWKALLRRWVQTHAKSDYTWKMPNRNYVHLGLYRPSLRSESLPEVWIHWDSSGSRDYDDARKECAAEVVSIIEECNPDRVGVVYCDTAVDADSVQIFERGDTIEFKPVGGGGTDIGPVFEYFREQGIEPAFMISITDLDISDLDRVPVPDFPVLFAKIGGYRPTAPFGEVILVTKEEMHGR